MAENTKIEWTDHTFNPWEGCQKVGPGCDHCYAETRNARFGGGVAVNWGPGAPRRRTSVANWQLPLKWDKLSEQWVRNGGPRTRVFCASLADVFDNAVDPAWRADLFALIRSTPNLDWLLLTKRIGNAHQMIGEALIKLGTRPGGAGPTSLLPSWPWLNVWIGATVVNREEMLRDAVKLKATPATVHFWSVEPMLGDLGELPRELLPDWVICGGESGPGARPMHPDWARSLRDQCAAAGVPFLFKQWGEWLPVEVPSDEECYAEDGSERQMEGSIRVQRIVGHQDMARVGKKAAGRLLDGRTHDGVPG